jgi:hypothetical protein
MFSAAGRSFGMVQFEDELLKLHISLLDFGATFDLRLFILLGVYTYTSTLLLFNSTSIKIS